MSYEFNEYERDPETQTSTARGMGPPRKGIGADILDSPGEAPIPSLSRNTSIFFWMRILSLVGLILWMVMRWLLGR